MVFAFDHPIRRWLAFGWFAKGAWGYDFLDVDVSLVRGDGFFHSRPSCTVYAI